MKLLHVDILSSAGDRYALGWVAPERVPEVLRMYAAEAKHNHPAEGVAVVIRVSP